MNRKSNMKDKKVTMTDIAEAAGVSQATVSIVLNGKGDNRIAPETCEAIFKIAQKLGYKTPKKSNADFISSVLYITDSITDSQMAPYLIKGAQLAARENGKNLIILTDLLDHQEDLAQILKKFNPHSVILAASILREIKVSAAILDYNAVLLNCIDKDHKLTSIMPDDRFGAQEATQHLISKGCRNIICITGEHWMMATQNRLEGYKLALITNNISYNEDYIYDGNWSVKNAHDITLEALEKHSDMDAIFSFSDFMSQGVYHALQKKNKIIGQDIQVMSFDNHDLSSQLTPRLSSVNLPHEQMGEMAIDYLIQQQNNFHGSRIVLPCHVKKRQSS